MASGRARRALTGCAAALFLWVGLAPGSAPAAEPWPGLPGADGVPLEAFAPPPILVAGQRVTVRVMRPVGWDTHLDAQSLLLEPTPNPGDVGFMVLLAAADDGLGQRLAADADLPDLLGQVLDEPTVTHREPVSLLSDGVATPAVLLHLDARFDNHRRGRFLALYAVVGPVAVVAVCGASEDVFGPFDTTLRDLLLSVQVDFLTQPAQGAARHPKR